MNTGLDLTARSLGASMKETLSPIFANYDMTMVTTPAQGSLVAQSFSGKNARRRPGGIQRRHQGNPDGHQRDQDAIDGAGGEGHVVDGINLRGQRQQMIVPARPGQRIA